MMNSKIYFFLCKKIFLNIKKNNGQEILLYFLQMAKKNIRKIYSNINPLTQQRKEVSVFTYPYLSVGSPSPGEDKGLMNVTFRSSPKKNLSTI